MALSGASCRLPQPSRIISINGPAGLALLARCDAFSVMGFPGFEQNCTFYNSWSDNSIIPFSGSGFKRPE